MTDLDLDVLAVQLRGTLGVLYRRIRQTRQTGELSLPESSLLSRLEQGGPMTGAELAKLEHISPQSVGATVASLEARGLIARSADPGDGRRVILSLTGSGARTVDAKRSARTEQLSRALAALSPQERAQLQAALPLLERLAAEL